MAKASGRTRTEIDYYYDLNDTIPDLLTNRLDWSVLSNVKEFSDSGQIRVIATTGKERW